MRYRVITHFLEVSVNQIAGVEEVEALSYIRYLERG